ncbi:TPA: LOW QUALITY PROTEIN: hypothetical protein N0F65_004376, partial [Lagenidium giganteum]
TPMKPLEFTPCGAMALWWLILTFCVLNVLYLLVLAGLYWNYTDPNGSLRLLTLGFLYSASADFLYNYHVIIAVGYALLALVFFLGILRMCWFRRRRIRVEAIVAIAHTGPSITREIAGRHTTFVNVTNRLHDGAKAVGMTGPYFTPFILTLETVEIALQTWQAHQMSKYISNLSVNQLYGIMIFVNCWSTSLIHYWWGHKRHHPMMARFLSVFVDAVLDVTWGCSTERSMSACQTQAGIDELLQVPENPDRELRQTIALSFLIACQTQAGIDELLQVPENPDRELRQTIALSFPNLFLSVYPFVSSAIAMNRVFSLLNTSRLTKSSNGIPSVTIAPGKQNRPVTSDASGPRGLTSSGFFRSKIMLVYLASMMVYGLIILGISVTASGVFWAAESSDAECVFRLYPWLTRKTSCVGRQINCTRLGLEGTKVEMSDVLGSVSAYLLGNLAFTDCAKLQIPSAIHNLAGLGTISVRRSTLVEWSTEASITTHSFPELQSLHLLATRVNCTPEGIMTEVFRVAPTDNAEGFIYNVTNAWNPTVYFSCVGCGLHEIPTAVDAMDRLQQLRLENNSIPTLPAARIQAMPKSSYVQVPGNPSFNVSDDAWRRLVQMTFVDVRFTNVATIPADALGEANSHLVISGYGSPLCGANSEVTHVSQLSCDVLVSRNMMMPLY